IEKVLADSLAEKSGFQANDEIMEINGKDASSIDNVQDYIEQRLDRGSSVMVLYQRGGKQDMIKLKK
ncbi:MAG: PDZ domain-containing protein, partial [Fretibacterium sp.]|nr:PDZ domain-containing protein [Fretibacterium sp.]